MLSGHIPPILLFVLISNLLSPCRKIVTEWNPLIFLLSPQLIKDDFPAKSDQRCQIPTPVKVKAPTPLEDRVKIFPSPQPVPITSGGMIGWRSSVDNLKLERYGGYAKPKGSILKSFKWPAEAAIWANVSAPFDLFCITQLCMHFVES